VLSLSLELLVGGQTILDEAMRLDTVATQLYDRCRPQTYPIFVDSDWAQLWDVYSDFEELFCEPVSDYPNVRTMAVSAIESRAGDSAKLMTDIIDLAHSENVSEWIESINNQLSRLGGTSNFQVLAAQMELSKAELWMALLMGGFRLTGGESFYGDDFLIFGDEL
jgi:hypothetical protein